MIKNRESFVFHIDWYNALSQLGNDLRLELYDAIMRKAFYGEPPALSTMGNLAMSFIEPQIERDYDKWLDIKEKRSNAGKKHKGNQYVALKQNKTNKTNVPSVQQNRTNGSVSVSVSDNVNVDNKNVILKEKEDKSSLKKSMTRFVKPTIEEIDAYVKEKGYHIDAESFFNFYESKGWVVGKSPMKNWKSACGTWEKTWKDNHPQEVQTTLFPSIQNNNEDIVVNGQIYR